MNNFAVELWDDEGTMCTFYTVRWLTDDDDNLSETDKFFEKYEKETNEYFDQSNQLLWLVLESIGNKYGPIDDFFDRNKNKSQALPPKPKKRIPEIEEIGINFPLRLYCYKISESIVVLFNGGIKDKRTDQLSKEISFKFYEAQQFAERIEDGLRNNMIQISTDRKYLIDFNGNKEIIL